jgi:ribulose kinase
VPISLTAVPEAVTLGSAILASVAAGLKSDVKSAAHDMVSVVRVIEPDANTHEAYKFFYEKYIASYEAMRTLMHEVVEHVST